ncbi:MAG: hypothetical protein MJE77_07165 [Proteobacteria bacterium]|nr:hypothetical protein [Pseudomonadota bacterium]
MPKKKRARFEHDNAHEYDNAEDRSMKAAYERSMAATIRKFERLLVQWQRQQLSMSFMLNERMLLILLFAAKGPIGAPELRMIVYEMRDKPYYDKLRRLQHNHPAYALLKKMWRRGLLNKRRRGRRCFYVIAEAARTLIAERGRRRA